MTAYKNILVAVDLSEVSARALEKAVALAQVWGARLSLCHVIEPMYYHGYPYVAEFETALIDHTKKEMRTLGERFHISEENLKICSGSVKVELMETAKRMQIDLMIVGRHGHSGLARLLGSSASAILHGSACDVLVIHEE